MFQFAPASFGQPQSAVNVSAQFQPVSQMHAPVGGQPWLSSGSQSGAIVTPVHQAGQQPSNPADVPVSVLFIFPTIQSCCCAWLLIIIFITYT